MLKNLQGNKSFLYLCIVISDIDVLTHTYDKSMQSR